MRSREARLTHLFLRTLVRPVVGHLPITLQRRMVEGILRAGISPRIQVEAVTAAGVNGEWLTPENVAGERILYYIHGGGYCLGSLASHRMFVAWLARKLRCRALHIDYRLAPEHPFPAGLNDVVAVYKWILDQGIRPADVWIGGESAGGGLTLAALVSLRDAGLPLPAAGLLISPWIDLTMSGKSIQSRAASDPMITHAYMRNAAGMYHGDQDPRSPLISPLFAGLHGLPPLLVHVGENEVLLDDAKGLAERCRLAGTEVTLKIWDDLFHAFPLFSYIPEAGEAMREIETHFQSLSGR